MSLMQRIARAQAKATPPASLAVSTQPWPGDVRLTMHVQPDAPLGFADVQLGLGKGTRGRGQRAGDDPALQVATLRRLAAHLVVYAAAFEQAARADGTL